MTNYKYLGYYNDNADIKDIIEAMYWNNPDGIAKYYERNLGNFHISDSMDDLGGIESVDNKTVFISNDGKYIVSFSEGHYVALDEDDTTSINAGFFIDIWRKDDEPESIDLSDEALKRMSDTRRQEDKAIKRAIIDEFKARFKNPGEGLDIYSNADTYVYGMLDSTGCIGQMYLRSDGKIVVTLVQEYEDDVVSFEHRFFACDDWPLLLMTVRAGLAKGWTLDDEEEEE